MISNQTGFKIEGGVGGGVEEQQQKKTGYLVWHFKPQELAGVLFERHTTVNQH